MKLILAFIPHHKLDDVKNQLAKVDVTRMTVTDSRGYGRQKGHTEIFRGKEMHINFVSKLEIKIAVNDEFVKPAVEAIQEACFTGSPGDGKIIVMPIEEVYRISTRESGKEAI